MRGPQDGYAQVSPLRGLGMGVGRVRRVYTLGYICVTPFRGWVVGVLGCFGRGRQETLSF